MKLAISIPDKIYQEAEHFAKTAQTTRSGLYTRALVEFMARHAPDRVMEAMDQAVDAVGVEADTFRPEAAKRALRRSGW